MRAALRDVQEFTARTSELAGLANGWRLLVLERLFDGGPGRLHLVQDGRLVASVDTDTSTLPTEPAQLRRFADEALQTSDDECDDAVARPRRRGFPKTRRSCCAGWPRPAHESRSSACPPTTPPRDREPGRQPCVRSTIRIACSRRPSRALASRSAMRVRSCSSSRDERLISTLRRRAVERRDPGGAATARSLTAFGFVFPNACSARSIRYSLASTTLSGTSAASRVASWIASDRAAFCSAVARG